MHAASYNKPMTLSHYLTHHRRYEALLWLAWIATAATANSIISTLDLQRMQQDFLWWEPILWECSSALLFLLLLPAVMLAEQRFPLQRPRLGVNLLIHLLFSVVYSVLHVIGMVAIRHLVYALNNSSYDFGHWPTEMAYEYLKDVRTYAAILVVIYLYRFILRRLQGEASLPDDTETESNPSDRFLIKKLGKEFLVRIDDIEWLEAAGNYVNLHAKGRVYPMRETMTVMSKRLQQQGFARVHRSIILNLDKVDEIEPLDSGDARARLHSGERLPISRRYRAELKALLS